MTMATAAQPRDGLHRGGRPATRFTGDDSVAAHLTSSGELS